MICSSAQTTRAAQLPTVLCRAAHYLTAKTAPLPSPTANQAHIFGITWCPRSLPIIGYTHPVYGQAGLEASLDPYLRGLQGNPTLLIWWDHLLYGQPPHGLNVRLSLDLDTQKRADELLGEHTGAVVLLNAQTGEILTMASHPTFDANLMDTIGETLPNAPNAPLLNRATQGLYPVSSAISPLLDAAYGPFTPSDKELVSFYEKLGFYNTPELRLPAAAAAPNGTLVDLRVSPIQMAIAAAALSKGGLCPGAQIASAVETPVEGWVVLPGPGEPAPVPARRWRRAGNGSASGREQTILGV